MIDKFWTWWRSTEVNQSKIDIDGLKAENKLFKSSLEAIDGVCRDPEQGNLSSIIRIGNIAGEALNGKTIHTN